MSRAVVIFCALAVFCLALGLPASAQLRALARTPTIDGVVEDGEWIARYLPAGADAPAGASFGVGWDSNKLYLLVQAPSLAKAVVYLDAAGDGWLNGADNYEITLAPAKDRVNVQTRLYNSYMSSPAKAIGPVVADVTADAKLAGDATVLEAAIGRNKDTGLELYPGRKPGIAIGVALASDASVLRPQDPRSEMTQVELVTSASEAPDGLSVSLKTRDRRVVPGQEVLADLEIRNTGSEPIVLDGYTVAGESRIADLVNLVKVPAQILDPGKKTGITYKTKLSESMPVGAFLLAAKIDLEGGGTALANASLDVVEPVDVSLDTGSGPAAPGTEREVTVTVTSNSNSTVNGSVQLIVPEALAGALAPDKEKLGIRSADATQVIRFKLKLPEDTAPGSYDISAEVNAGSYKRTLPGVLVVR